MEKINVFVVALPTFDSVVEKIKDAIEDAFEKPKFKKSCFCCDDFEDDFEDDEDFTPREFKVNEPCNGVQPWGIKGTPADENLRFGYGLEVDEPRCEDYDCRWEFEDDHEAFDRFVEAGEDCVARGLDKKSNAPIHKCNAIRKPIGCPPPMNRNLIGETHWWETFEDFDF
jgi:hypothetical protein